jgi:hypothetical protein
LAIGNQSSIFATMTDHNDSSRRKYAAGVICGIGGGLLISTVLYRHVTAAELTDPLRVVGFALLFGGGFFVRRIQSRE